MDTKIKKILRAVLQEPYIRILLVASVAGMIFNSALGGSPVGIVAIALGFLTGVLVWEFSPWGRQPTAQEQAPPPVEQGPPEQVAVREEKKEVPETPRVEEKVVILDSKLEEEVKRLRAENEEMRKVISELIAEFEKTKKEDRGAGIVRICARYGLDPVKLDELMVRLDGISPPQVLPQDFFKTIKKSADIQKYIKALRRAGYRIRKKGKQYVLMERPAE